MDSTPKAVDPADSSATSKPTRKPVTKAAAPQPRAALKKIL